MAGSVTDEQVVAANVDVIFIVMALDADFSLRRLERYLLLARESGAAPVVLLTKPDLADDVAAQVAEVVAVAGDVPVHVVSPKLNAGLDQVAALSRRRAARARCSDRRASARPRSSTAWSATTCSKTREVREADSKGRTRRSHRELVVLPNGGLIIDTPGMRELQLWDVGEAVRETFDDIEALAAGCHFTDCRHRDEPRCAVKAAVEDGRLAADRLESYLQAAGRAGVPGAPAGRARAARGEAAGRSDGQGAEAHLKTKRG